MQKIKKITSMMCAVFMLLGVMVPAALAAGESRWVEKAPMPGTRSQFNSVAVSGNIYVLGGAGVYSKSISLQIYNPDADTWTTGAQLSVRRYNYSSEVVGGKIYLIGGQNADGNSVVPTIEIYDPATNTFTIREGKNIFGTRSATINGKIYLIGGKEIDANGEVVFIQNVRIYNPATNTWTTGAQLPTPREKHMCQAINGKIYVVGGRYNDTPTQTLDIYNPATNTWTTGASMPVWMSGSASVAVGNQIYVIGGVKNGGPSVGDVYIYDTVTDSWSTGPSITFARSYLGAAFVNHTIYAFGGQTGANGNKVEALNLAPNKLAILLNAGEAVQLSVSYNLLDNETLTWTSSDANVAAVDTKGKVTAIGPGLCDITAESADGAFKESIFIRVMPGTADPFRLAVHLKPAQNAKLYLTEEPADTTWNSLDTAVATVDAAGRVTAVSQGLAIMEATSDGETH